MRQNAIQALLKRKIKPADAEPLEGLLTRKSADLRTGVVALILTLNDAQAIASAERLLASKDNLRRLAGLEVLRQLAP